jgi:hypothetical protein
MPFRISRLGSNAWNLEELQGRRQMLQEEAGCWGILRLPDNDVERGSVLSLAEENLRMPTQPSLNTHTAYVMLSEMSDGSNYISGWYYRMKDLPEHPYDNLMPITFAALIHRGTKISVSGTRPKEITKDIWGEL